MMNAKKAPLLVVGIGNAIQMDDGVGIHVLRALEGRELPPGVELFDGGTMGIELLPWLEDREKVIFIDAVDAQEKPGTIFRFAPEEVDYDMIPKASVHEIGLVDAIQMAALTGRAPREAVIFGVQPARIDWGEELSEELAAVVERVARLVMNEIHESVAERVPTSSGGVHE